jgi:secondary thiamine-phosphate synthase enzyme
MAVLVQWEAGVVVKTESVRMRTQGDGDTLDITAQVAEAVERTGIRAGTATVFCTGSTCGVTTIEFEPGAVADFQRLFDEIAPADQAYRHHLRWGDDNGHSHVRSALLGCSLTVPFSRGRLLLGTWQQIVLVDFDTHPRNRELVVQVMGE